MNSADTIPSPAGTQNAVETPALSKGNSESIIETSSPRSESEEKLSESDGKTVHETSSITESHYSPSDVNSQPRVATATQSYYPSTVQQEFPAIHLEESEDSLKTTQGEERFGITLTPPVEESPEWVITDHTDLSIVISCLLILFCVIAFRFRDNRKYLAVMIRNLVDVRERQNIFDETVRETSFLLLLNLMWCFSTGIILYSLLTSGLIDGGGVVHNLISGIGIAICTGVAMVYTLFMTGAYVTVGSVFRDLSHARLWLKGYAASQAIMSFFYFPLALLFLCYPAWSLPLFWIAGIVFVVSKLAFITKGARIFFNQFSSWVLFLYYLCSLEIVPLILSYLAAVALWNL